MRLPARCTFLLLALPALAAAQPDRGALIHRIDSVVTAELARTKTPAATIAVSRNGALLHARGFGHEDLESGTLASTETVYRIGSITKQFTATLVLRLVEQGKIGLDDEITKYVPNYPTHGNAVTIRHLLTHTSGIKSYTSLGPSFWNESARLDLNDEQMLDLFKDQPFDFKPGEKYRYNNSAYYLLGVIIGKVTGTPYPTYVRQQLFEPLGLATTSYCDDRAIVPHRSSGYEVQGGAVVNAVPLSLNTPGAAGALCSTVLDLMAWQRALDAASPLSAASRDQMRTSARLNSGEETGYGFGISVRPFESHRSFAHSGGINGFASWLARYPDDDVTVAVLTNSGSGPAVRIGQLIARVALGLPLPVIRDLPVAPAERAELLGTYDLVQAKITVSDGPDGLMARIDDGEPSRLMYQGEGRYKLASNPDFDIRIDSEGGTRQMVVTAEGARLVGKKMK